MSEADPAARIILEDGTEFEGVSRAWHHSSAGEILVYTGETGLPALLTDPALKGAILVLTRPVAGVTGIPDEENDTLALGTTVESTEVQIAGLVCSSLSLESYHYRSKKTLARWLKRHQIPVISGIDTSALVRRINLRGNLRAKILVSQAPDISFSAAKTGEVALQSSVKRTIVYGTGPKRILVVDCGARNSVIRSLVTPRISVIRVPAASDWSSLDCDGIVVAGGPGDPTTCEKAISILSQKLSLSIPIFATGQGAVILGIAAGGAAYRMARGHHSPSVPCVCLETGRCYLTAQNHGYGIRSDSLPSGWDPLFLNNADQSLEGFSTKKGLIKGVLFQPEGHPGPHETDFLWTEFVQLVDNGGPQA